MVDKQALPRVTYSNVAADFGPLHDWLDIELPKFRAGLGAAHSNVVAGVADQLGKSFTVTSPIDRSLVIGRFVDAVTTPTGKGGLPWLPIRTSSRPCTSASKTCSCSCA